MGTYTTNYNLFLPTIGEQGWGDLVNGNFATIDATMKGLDMRVGTLETETDAVEERVTVLEAGKFDNIEANTIVGNVDITNSLLYVPYPEIPSIARTISQYSYNNGTNSGTDKSISMTNPKFIPTTGILCKTFTIETYCDISENVSSFTAYLYGTKDGTETLLNSANGVVAKYTCSMEDYLSYLSFRYRLASQQTYLVNRTFTIYVKSYIA